MTDEVRFYYRSRALYRPGERVLPGGWGRLVLGSGHLHPYFELESVWEEVRRAEFPDRPSRLEAAFACDDLKNVQAFRREIPENIYAVTIDPGAITHRTDMSWVNSAIAQKPLLPWYSVDCARNYWRGEIMDPSKVEVLVMGELGIVARVEGPAVDHCE